MNLHQLIGAIRSCFLFLVVLLLLTSPLATSGNSFFDITHAQSPMTGSSPTAECSVPGDFSTIQEAVNDANCATISISGGAFHENVIINRQVSIIGQGSANTEVNGGGAGSVFTIRSGSTVTLTGLLITNGSSAILGGGVFNEGSLTIDNCTISDNSAPGEGGGVHNEGGTTTIGNSTISSNSAYFGGGVGNYQGTITIDNSTISGNSANDGGGISNGFGTVIVTNSTINGNMATDFGSSITNAGSLTLRNTMVANGQGAINCSGEAITSQGYNLDSDNTCNLIAAGDLPNHDPRLDSLQDNGGATFTHALLNDSPAIDAGYCPDASFDQRGYSRPFDISNVPNAADGCDIGAFEFHDTHEYYLPYVSGP
ncbi:MAG: right-handed parallel beta-helix repeat-containing protein [Candidatus Promineifilaceae bacterium]|nr:right-handed parallel beta-helix repeat-containing protein [Candidatus Promineifilaceae bacterium]